MSEEQLGAWSQGPNLAADYRERARQLARSFGVLEGVVGVALIGGIPLGQADRYSDIDLAVYLRHHTLQAWLLGGAPLPEGESRYRGMRLDLSYRDYAEEQEREWDSSERWQATAAEILYDPEGLVAALFREKAGFGEAEHQRVLASEFTATQYLLDTVVPAWLYRGDPIAAHHALNLALSRTIRLVYLVNGRPAPAQKWLTHLADDLPWRPERWRERLSAALTVTEPTNADAGRRRHLLTGLVRDCWARVAPADTSDLAPPEAERFLMLREVAERGRIPLQEFRERYGLRALIESPAFDLLSVERQIGHVDVVFDAERLMRIVEHELGRFLDPHQRVLRRLAALQR